MIEYITSIDWTYVLTLVCGMGLQYSTKFIFNINSVKNSLKITRGDESKYYRIGAEQDINYTSKETDADGYEL